VSFLSAWNLGAAAARTCAVCKIRAPLGPEPAMAPNEWTSESLLQITAHAAPAATGCIAAGHWTDSVAGRAEPAGARDGVSFDTSAGSAAAAAGEVLGCLHRHRSKWN
jgi:hypothetical protein